MKFDLFHGSIENVTQITSSGFFGGLFASPSKSVALSHGDVLHVIDSPKHLTDFELNYEIDGAYDIALELADGRESLADAIMSPGCECPDDVPDDDFTMGLEIQAMRGELARRLGYTSIEMLDEHGTTYLCLPGCSIRLADNAG